MKKQLARLLGFDTEKATSLIESENIEIGSESLSDSHASTQTAEHNAINIVNKEHSEYNVQTVLLSMIDVNPFQPRKTFNDHTLDELSQSIKEYGVIQPILIRQNEDRYELIAGERRFRAAKLAGLEFIPAIIKDLTLQDTAEIAMVENLQREDLNFLEEAEGYQVLLSTFGLTQEELARRVGKSQSTIANKLRLLKLPDSVRNEISQDLITERHARALLKLPDEQHQIDAIRTIKTKEMTVRQAEEYIEQTLSDISQEISAATPKQRIIKIFKDIRIFINTIHNVVNEMRKAGLDIKVKETTDADYINIHLQIPKKRKDNICN